MPQPTPESAQPIEGDVGAARADRDVFLFVLMVSPAFDADGCRASSGRGLLFDAQLEGEERVLVRRTHQPLLDACRVLVADGVNPATQIVMRHVGSQTDALVSTVGGAAKLRVKEDGAPPRFRPWTPFPSRPVESSVRFEEQVGASDSTGRERRRDRAMTAHASPLTNWVAVYAGQICVGHVMSRGPRLFEAFGPDDKSIGVFKTPASGIEVASSRLSPITPPCADWLRDCSPKGSRLPFQIPYDRPLKPWRHSPMKRCRLARSLRR
jgi:hypothetical protein